MRVLVLLLIAASAAHAQPRRGDAAPDPGIDAWLNAPAEASWTDTAGQAVVLDFWATWCAPCVAAIPHLNALADAFAGRPVVFVSLSDEPAATVAPFLARRPIRGLVGLDADSSGARAYGVSGIPQTALIGRDGRLAAIVHPADITAATIDSLLAGQVLRRPDRAARSLMDSVMAAVRSRPRPSRARPTEAVSQIRWLERGEWPGDRSGYGRPVEPTTRRAQWTGMLWWMLQNSWTGPGPEWPDGVRPDRVRVVMPDSLAHRTVTVDLVAPDVPEEAFRAYAFDEIGRALGLTIRDAEGPLEALVLRQSEGGMTLTPSTASGRSSGMGGVISVRGLTLREIAQALERCLEVPVVDETGARGTYAMQLVMDPETVHCDRPDAAQNAAVRAALRETAGLDLVPETRVLRSVVVEPRP